MKEQKHRTLKSVILWFSTYIVTTLVVFFVRHPVGLGLTRDPYFQSPHYDVRSTMYMFIFGALWCMILSLVMSLGALIYAKIKHREHKPVTAIVVLSIILLLPLSFMAWTSTQINIHPHSGQVQGF